MLLSSRASEYEQKFILSMYNFIMNDNNNSKNNNGNNKNPVVSVGCFDDDAVYEWEKKMITFIA